MGKEPTQFTKILNEGSTAIYQVNLLDENETPIPASGIDSLTLHFYELESGENTIINGRDQQNVLNANDVTVDENGLLTWNIQPEDGEILGFSENEFEVHRAEFDCVFNGGAGRATWDIDLVYRDLRKVNV